MKSPQPLSKWQQKSRWCLFPCIRQVLVSLIYHREQRFPSYHSSLLCFVHFASVRSGEEEKEEAHCFPLQFHVSLGAWNSAPGRGEGWARMSQDITLPISNVWLFFFPHPLEGISSNCLQLNHAPFAAWFFRLQWLPLDGGGGGRKGRGHNASQIACLQGGAAHLWGQGLPFQLSSAPCLHPCLPVSWHYTPTQVLPTRNPTDVLVDKDTRREDSAMSQTLGWQSGNWTSVLISGNPLPQEKSLFFFYTSMSLLPVISLSQQQGLWKGKHLCVCVRAATSTWWPSFPQHW